MSTVIYYVKETSFGFETNLQFESEDKLFDLEEHLMMEVTEHKKHFLPSIKGYVHDIIFEDDNGVRAVAKDFAQIGNLKIIKR